MAGTPTDVELLRSSERGMSTRALAGEHGLTQSYVSRAVRRARRERDAARAVQAERRRTADRERKRGTRKTERDAQIELLEGAGFSREHAELLASSPSARQAALDELDEMHRERAEAALMLTSTARRREAADYVRARAEQRRLESLSRFIDSQRIRSLGDDDLAVLEYAAQPFHELPPDRANVSAAPLVLSPAALIRGAFDTAAIA